MARVLDLYGEHVQERVIDLLVALGPYNPAGTTAEIVRAFSPQQRILMLMEKLPRRMRDYDRHISTEEAGP